MNGAKGDLHVCLHVSSIVMELLYMHVHVCTHVVMNWAHIIKLLTLIIQTEKPLAKPRVRRRGSWEQLPRGAGPRWPMERSLRSPYSKEAHNTLSLFSSFLGPDTACETKKNLVWPRLEVTWTLIHVQCMYMYTPIIFNTLQRDIRFQQSQYVHY
jgi:hypothetical protein